MAEGTDAADFGPQDYGGSAEGWTDCGQEKVEETVEETVYDVQWVPRELLGSLGCLATLSDGNTNWSSRPSAPNTEGTPQSFGECSDECLSFILVLEPATISPLMLKYAKLEVHLNDAGLLNTCVGEVLIYFRQMNHVVISELSQEESQAALEEHHSEAIARFDLIQIAMDVSQVTFNASNDQFRSVSNFDKAVENKTKSTEQPQNGYRLQELIALQDILRSQNIRIQLLIQKPVLKEGDNFADDLRNMFTTCLSTDRDQTPLDQWFPKSPTAHDLPLGHVPRPNAGLPKDLPRQLSLVRFETEDQYMVTHIVGSANQAFAEQAAVSDVVSSEFPAYLIPMPGTNDSQFIVAINPEGHDVYLPTYGEPCHIQLPQIKINRTVAPPDIQKARESLISHIEMLEDDDDTEFLDSIRQHLATLMSAPVDDATILELRRDEASSSEDHADMIGNFILGRQDSLMCEDAEASSDQEPIWFPATRMDITLPTLPFDTQIYVTSCPLQPRGEDADRAAPRIPISVELPFIELDPGCTIQAYLQNVVNCQNFKDFKAVIRRTPSDKTIKAEIHAINALHNPASATLATFGPQSLEAFKYIQSFQSDESTRSVNLHDTFPILGQLNQLDQSECPQPIQDQFAKLDGAKKVIIGKLKNLPAGLAFIPGVAGSGKTHLIMFMLAACIFGKGKPKPVPTMYVAPNNQAVDDMATKFHDYFENLGLDEAPTVMRLYGLDFEVKSLTSTLVPGQEKPFQHFDVDATEARLNAMDADVDPALQFLAVYQLQKMGLEMHRYKKSRSKRARILKNVSADTAAVDYYRSHIDKYPELLKLLNRSERDGNLEAEDIKEVRLLIKNVFHDMIADFKGIICTTPVVSANMTVRRFQPQLLFMDEAARQSELSALITIAHYNPLAWFFFGDPLQLTPYVGQAARATENPFIRQLSVSLLERATRASVELGWLDVTHRSHGNLRVMPSRVNYSKRMRGAPGTNKWPESTVAFAHELSRLLGPNASIRTSRLVVQFPRTRATHSGTSFENRTHVEWVLHQVKGFLKNDRLTDLSTTNPARILIVPLYKAQVNLYRQVLADERSKGCISDEDLQRLDVRTLDSSQGEERDLVIVDYVQTDQAGFCTDPNRNCLATTRAIQAEIIIMNEGMLADFRAQKSKLAQIIAHASEFNYKLEVLSCTNCNSPTHTDDDCNDQLSCSYCKQPGHARVTCPKIKCSNCRELGHLTSNCPKAKLCQQCGAEDSVMHKKACLGRRICSNCWKCHTGDACTKCSHCRGENHRANECRLNPEATRVKNKQLKCNRCNELGHKAGDCPDKPKRACYSCGSTEHVNRDCPNPRCKQCKGLGHQKSDCPEVRCKHCGQDGHTQSQCTNSLVYCKRCKRSGHVTEDCDRQDGPSAKGPRENKRLAAWGGFRDMKRNRGGQGRRGVYGVIDSINSRVVITDPTEASGQDMTGAEGADGQNGEAWGGESSWASGQETTGAGGGGDW